MEGRLSGAISERAQALFEDHIDGIRRRTDRLLAGLMAGQWGAAILIAATLSPYAWEGKARSVHPHVFAAVLLGGLITSFPVGLALLRPGALSTRCVVAAAQMLWSALLIHLTGGRIETHFHVFGSLAFLAFYRDWKVFIPATVVVASDHLVRQLAWPESVFGVPNPESWRFLEHAFWVVFEDVFLVLSCLRGTKELENLARQRAEIEDVSEKERERSAQLDWALTEALSAKEAAEKASEVKGHFLAIRCLLLCTRLHVVSEITQLLRRTTLTPKQRQYLETIRGSGESLLNVVNDVLDFSKMEAGKFTLQSLDFNPANVARSITDLLGPQASAKGIELTCAIDPSVPEVLRGDAGRLQQILNNLVGNAVKFTEKGRVSVRGTVVSDGADGVVLRFEVKDTGIGISETDVPRLFKAFSQVDGTSSRKYGGTGLGLAIVRQLVEMMGGEVEVKSELGKGSSFAFTVTMANGMNPIHARPPASTRDAAQTSSPGEGGALILVAEDNPVNQQVALEMLEALGYRADVVANGHAAVEAVQRGRYAAVLMDCQMPEMSGYEASIAIRGREGGGAPIPIIAVTAHAMEGDREKALEAGMDDYVTKPLTTAKLAKVLERWKVRESVAAQVVDPSVRRSKKVVEIFLRQLPPWSSRVREAMAERNAKRLKEEAHHMKGSCVSIGAAPMVKLCVDLEKAPERADELWPEIEQSMVALRAALQLEIMPAEAQAREEAKA